MSGQARAPGLTALITALSQFAFGSRSAPYKPEGSTEDSNTGIRIPAGASPEFASYPADVRAILQQEYILSPPLRPISDLTQLTCDRKGADSIRPIEGLELGRFYFRSGDFARGRCWLQFILHEPWDVPPGSSSALDRVLARARTISAVALQMGWGTPKNRAAAFEALKQITSDGTGSAWAVYFLKEAYLNGTGTPRDPDKAARIDADLRASSAGQDVYASIGADEIEKIRQHDRNLLIADPPMKSTHQCYGPTYNQVCHDDYDVDHDAFDRRLREIDAE